MSSEILLEASHLSKCYELYGKPSHRLWQTVCMGKRRFYQEFWALREVSLTLRRGESVGIIGCNGSGKSTLLQLLAGVLRPTTGEVKTGGRISALLELGSGFHPDYTGRENIIMGAALQGISDDELKRKYDEIVAFAAIGDFIEQPLKTYSSGMMVRLAFAVMTLLSPDILIIDEALAVGDCFFQAKCYSHLRKLLNNGVSLLFVSHAQPVVTALCDRCILLEKGQLRFDGNPASAFELYMKQQNSDADTHPGRHEPSAPPAVASVRESGSTLQPPFAARVVNRIGGRQSRFSDCLLLENEREVKQPHHHAEVAIRAVLTVEETLSDYEIGCVVSTLEGVQLFALNSFFNGLPPQPLNPGTHLIDFGFRMDLLPGTFFKVDLGLRAPVQGDYLDKAFNALVFEVAPPDGVLLPPLLVNIPHTVKIRELKS